MKLTLVQSAFCGVGRSREHRAVGNPARHSQLLLHEVNDRTTSVETGPRQCVELFGVWSLIILVYGIFMPNTWQRAAAILLPAACVPYLDHFRSLCVESGGVAEMLGPYTIRHPLAPAPFFSGLYLDLRGPLDPLRPSMMLVAGQDNTRSIG